MYGTVDEIVSFAWKNAVEDDLEGFKSRLAHYISARSFETTPERIKDEIKQALQSITSQRYNGHRKAEMTSVYWDKVVEYLPRAYNQKRPGHIYTDKSIEISQKLEQIITKHASTRDLEACREEMVAYVRPEIIVENWAEVEQGSLMTAQKFKDQHRKGDFWDAIIAILEDPFKEKEDKA